MTSLTAHEAHSGRHLRLGSWRTVAGLSSVAAGAAIVVGAALPWIETFAGLIGIPGLRGTNGRMLAAAGTVIAVGGDLPTGPRRADGPLADRRLAGFAALGFSGYLLIQLTRSMSVLGSDSMVAARGGPGLWVAVAGSAIAFGTLFLPPSSQTTLRRKRRAARAAAAGPGGLSLAWAADRESAGARRGLQIVLGMVWLLDAALQYQPYMFSSELRHGRAGPGRHGEPGACWPTPPARAARIIGHDVVAWNAVFATIQLALAAGLLWRRTARAALEGTVGWAWRYGSSRKERAASVRHERDGQPDHRGARRRYHLRLARPAHLAGRVRREPSDRAAPPRAVACSACAAPGPAGSCCGAASVTLCCSPRCGRQPPCAAHSPAWPAGNRTGWPP